MLSPGGTAKPNAAQEYAVNFAFDYKIEILKVFRHFSSRTQVIERNMISQRSASTAF
jgi:hypothetical protein